MPFDYDLSDDDKDTMLDMDMSQQEFERLVLDEETDDDLLGELDI